MTFAACWLASAVGVPARIELVNWTTVYQTIYSIGGAPLLDA